ncbi:hypothetical protein BH10ACI1_BH10ACI1_03900 [soil metagenome]
MNTREKAAGKKTNFFICDGCFKFYAAGTGINAPDNNQNLRVVCQRCYQQYLGGGSPMPFICSTALRNKFGSFMTTGGGKVSQNRYSQLATSLSNLLKKTSETAAGITQNIK